MVAEGWDLHPQSPGYEPGELLFLYPAIVALMGYVPISGVSQTILHKCVKERKFHYVRKERNTGVSPIVGRIPGPHH